MDCTPEGLECIGSIMSNMDHTIEDSAEEKLKAGGVYGMYPAMDFFAHVWFADGKFRCMIMCYGSHVDTLTADTLQGIMELASDKHGWE